MSLSDRINDTNAAPWVIGEIKRIEAERDALTAHVEKLNNKLADINNSLYGLNLHIAGWHLNGDTEPMDTWFEENDWEPEPCGCNSLARLKAEWQTEAFRQFITEIEEAGWETSPALVVTALYTRCEELRRQAEGGE